MSQDDLPPELDDFQTELKSIHVNSKSKPNNSQLNTEDYTKVNTRHIQDEEKFKAQKQKIKTTQVKIQKQIQKTKKKQQFGGFKKGFFSNNTSAKTTNPLSTKVQPKQQKIPEIKAPKKNPLQIKQVQQAMKMNNYLDETRKQWMTQNFLNNISSNQKINKLFTNPEYMKAIDMFKTNPKQAMMRYGNNKQFMEGFQQFCKMMGMQFQNLATQSKPNK